MGLNTLVKSLAVTLLLLAGMAAPSFAAEDQYLELVQCPDGLFYLDSSYCAPANYFTNDTTIFTNDTTLFTNQT